MRLNVQPFDERHNCKAFLIAPTAIIAGLGISVGLPVIKVPGATGDMDSNYEAKAQAAIRELKGDYDVGIIHMKGVDDAAHDGKVLKKAELVERADSAIHSLIKGLSEIEQQTGERFIISIIADHTTSSTWLDHTFEPVAFAVSEVSKVAEKLNIPHKNWETELIAPAGTPHFHEVECCTGPLGRFCGSKLFKLLFHFAQRPHP